MERNILDLAARKGLSLYTTENAAGSLSIASLAVSAEEKIDNSPKKMIQKKGDFIFKFVPPVVCPPKCSTLMSFIIIIIRLDDMLAILFPHMYEEIEFLIPPDDVAMNGVENGGGISTGNKGGSQVVNAVAGPSRLS